MHQLKAFFLCLMLNLTATIIPAGQLANPLNVRLADSHVLLDGGVYYLYATSASNGYKVWTSTGLVNWRDYG